ncbi:hypothetical protein MIMGU_mgv1a012591mg [Erythranthe guttata]|uniref:RING-type domain-containing protein n=1 Tax=Erythranthe guttata TaxID=4155 RepID=A0A022RE05_ERYGU|nr:hypothetical protein MIMGU_mgv1a012591mg [Erythranthe guttata]
MAIQAQMYTNFDLLSDNACGFNNNNNNLCFIPHQQKEQQQQQEPMMNRFLFQTMSSFPQSISAQMENQRIEIDLFINSQNEKLRLVLEEQRKRHTSLLLKKLEPKIQFLFRQKDEEIKTASYRTTELENFLRRIEFENQTWQRAAMENESTVKSLTGTIERLREAAANAASVDDAGSCCVEEEERENGENLERETRKKMVCRRCNYGNSCVIMLPCRHLCSCIACAAVLDSCPVCRVRSVHASIF